MEKPRVVTGKFALSFSLNVLSIFVHISGAIRPSTLIWVLLERSFPPVKLGIDHDGNLGQKWWRQKWKKAKGSSRPLVFSSAKYCQGENLHVLGLRIFNFFQDHEGQCPYTKVQCMYPSCGALVLREDLSRHLEEECMFRQQQCQYCKLMTTADQLKVTNIFYENYDTF